MTSNPVIATITRGGTIESQHRGSYVVSDAKGAIVTTAGDIDFPVFPRSAIKAFQCVPLIESGAAERFGLNDEEIALCCASHNGEAEHLRVAASILAKAGNEESSYECGAHWPHERNDVIAIAKAGEEPRAIHNNCSGKHAGMLALARQLGAPSKDYSKLEHPVQLAVRATIEKLCDINLAQAPVGIDGCSVPTWAIPLRNMALGFARLADPGDAAGTRIMRAVRHNPFMIEGSTGFDTKITQAVPRLFIKYGAEAVCCGAIPHAGLGFALKVDDGSKRAAHVAIAGVLLELDVWTEDEARSLHDFANVTMTNWRKIEVGEIRAAV